MKSHHCWPIPLEELTNSKYTFFSRQVGNVAFGVLAYITFGRALVPPKVNGAEIEGCDVSQPFVCDNVIKVRSTIK